MKVILLRDVAKIGRKGSLVEVPDGYARNQLIPTKSAEAATPQSIKKHQNLVASKEAVKDADTQQFSELKKQLAGMVIPMEADANEKDHLFKAVSKDEVVTAADKQGITINATDIVFTDVIKSLGEHQVELRHAGDTAVITIMISKK